MYLTGDIDAADNAAADAAAAGFVMGLAVGMLEGRFTPYIGVAAFSFGLAQAKQAWKAGYTELAVLDFTLAIFSFFTGVYRPLAAQARGAGRLPVSAANAAPSRQPIGDVYSVAFEMKLKPADYGRSRGVHFRRANASLDAAISSDPAFAAQMERMIPGVGNAVSSVGGRGNPSGWTWHHHSTEPGVMQLVPQVQHAPGSIFSSTLHPGGQGGYSIWAIPAGAPENY